MGYPGRVRLRVNPFLFRVKKIGFGSCFFGLGQKILTRIAMSIGGVVVVV